ncbi:MAG: hypothetical protein JWM80_2611 [Cyanobacteria bacterium RYN_339]|nr:hypothetical protein [Cyanobacteria bacterium RYN_339]
MPLNFRKRIRLFPGITLNYNGTGMTLTVGIPGFHMTFGPRGTRATASIPGTGVSYTKQNRHKR